MATYNGFTKTLYPGQIDERGANANFKANIDFADRTSATDPKDYYVMADDVNALQEGMIAIQRSLGVMPQGENMSSDVATRILNLENFVLKDLSATEGFSNLDQRYMWGGAKPVGLADNAKLSIKYHLHDGTAGGADKIDLANHVTGLLKKANLDLTSKTASMLSAADILLSQSSTQTVADRFNDKYDKTGGLINGAVTIAGAANSRFFVELDVATTSTAGTVGTNIADIHAESGNARRSAGGTGTLFTHSQKLRYGDYVACFRMKVDANASASQVCKLYVTDGTKETSFTLSPSMFTQAGQYDMVYLEFRHKNNHGTTARPNITVGAYFYSGITNVNIDSVVITPIHTAVYDDDTNTLL